MWQRFTERARKIVFNAQEEAQRVGEGYVSTEHLLLGLTREDDSVAAKVLLKMNIHLARVRRELERVVPRGDARPSQDMTLTPRAKRVIDLAYDEARNLNNNYIGTEHVLLGLIREAEGLAGRVLISLGAELMAARAIVCELQDADPKSINAPTGRTAGLPPHYLPALLSLTRLMAPDLLALILLMEPSEALDVKLRGLGLHTRVLAFKLERAILASGPVEPARFDSFPGVFDAGGGMAEIFGRLARHPQTRIHQVLAGEIGPENLNLAFAESGDEGAVEDGFSD